MSTILDWLKWARDLLVAWFWQIATAVLVFVVALVVVRPFDRIEDPAPEDVATAWNRSIGRLGILPLYPPTEDFAVGDVLAVIADTDNVPLLGKAVRIAHIDFRDSILSSNSAPVFAETAEKGASYRKQDRLEVPPSATDNRRIPLAISAFPGITINHVTQSGAAAANAGGWFGSTRRGQSVEEILITGAETYGVPTIDAIIKLNNWCREGNTKAYCDDSFARQALAFAVSDRVLATKSDNSGQEAGAANPAKATAYATRLQLQLVTRVYLTREIIQRRLDETAGGAAVQALANPSQVIVPQPGGKPVDQSGTNQVSNAAELEKGLAASGTPGARLSAVRSDGVDLGLRATFQRPVAFGYRAVTIALEPAIPGKDRVP